MEAVFLWGPKVKKVFGCLLLAGILAACVSTGDMQLSKNVYQVNVEAGGALFVGGAENAALKRAAELTLANGYKSFVINNPTTQSSTNYVGSTSGYSQTNVQLYGNAAYGQTTYTPGIPIYRRRKDVSLTVIMLNPGDPGFENAIDAQATLKRLSS